MKGSPIHQNLSTSFVDLSALVRHLRERQFTGTVRVELDLYEAEIFFTRTNRLQAREYDKVVGRIAQGEHALERIMKRSREPFGIIQVLRTDAEEAAAYLKKPFVDDRILAEARGTVFGKCDQVATISEADPHRATVFDNAKAGLRATDPLLTFNEPFQKSGIDFDVAFGNACELLARRHSHLNPETGDFSFYRDEIFISERVSTEELFEGIVAALRHMVEQLRPEPRFAKVLIYLKHRIQLHLSARHDDYRSFELTPIVDRLLA